MTKQVLIIGFARSGAAAAKLLSREGANVLVSDPNLNLEDSRVQQLKTQGIQFTQEQGIELLDQIDLIIKNPGIPHTIPILQVAHERGIKIEVEVAEAQKYIQGNWIAITGSNGKTTTTEMIAAVMRAMPNAKGHTLVAGNIGTPVSEVTPSSSKDDVIITELSSFQLNDTPNVHPHFAVITNIFASHLDWHKTRKAYINAKRNITINQNSDDYLIINWDDEEWQALAQSSRAQIVPFSRKNLTQAGAYLKDGWLYFKEEKIMAVDQLGVPGDHNIENALAAIAVGRLNQIPAMTIANVLHEFSGVKHRLQFVNELKKRKIYNDSKATDIEATQKALSGFQQPVVLLAGGLDRGDDLSRLSPDLKAHVKAMVTFGQTGAQLTRIANDLNIPVVETESVKSAFAPAFALSAEGDIILFSPAAASWDQFDNFEIRGDVFVEAMQEFIAQKEQD